VLGADNQQERLDSYISGYVDGEGCFAVAVNRNPTCRSGYQLVPEFHVSQNGDRAQVLHLIRKRFDGCGYIKPNGRKDRALVYVVRRREDLMERVIPFFERSMALGHHRTPGGFSRLLDEALSMNGGGRFWSVRWKELVGSDPESSETVRRTGE
jgi:LAGLIDADG DNA endonuclease family protein